MKYPTLRHHQRCGNLKVQTTKPRRSTHSAILILSCSSFQPTFSAKSNVTILICSSTHSILSENQPKQLRWEGRPCLPNHPPNLPPNLAPTLRPKPNRTVAIFSLARSFPPIARLTPTLSELILTPPNPRWNTNHPPKIAASPAVCKLKTRVSSKSKTMLSNSNWSPSVSNKARSPMLQVAALRPCDNPES